MLDERVSLITSAATHGYLPLLGSEGALSATRLACNRMSCIRVSSRGVWLPDAAIVLAIIGLRRSALIDKPDVLCTVLGRNCGFCGLEFFFVDSHFDLGRTPFAAYTDYFPQLDICEKWPATMAASTRASPYTIRRVVSPGGKGRQVFFRDLETARQVWSLEPAIREIRGIWIFQKT